MPRILVIDDDHSLRSVVVRMLTRAGYDVSEAASGKEGLRAWRAGDVDLVLTDIEMPTNGIKLIEKLRVLAPGLPVMVMSGGRRSRSADSLEQARSAGAVAVLEKPFSREQLLAAVAKALEPPDHPIRPGTA
jgi:CheY-like chemotaxis protein